MKCEININIKGTTIKLPCGCVINYDTNELIKTCKKHKEVGE